MLIVCNAIIWLSDGKTVSGAGRVPIASEGISIDRTEHSLP
jgi:hypothetical protein